MTQNVFILSAGVSEEAMFDCNNKAEDIPREEKETKETP